MVTPELPSIHLVRLDAGRWEVLLAEQVILELSDWSSAKGPKKAMLSFLRQSVTLGGPQESNRTVCIVFKPFTLKLAEFRKGEHRGTKVRVIWFYGDEGTRRRVVCVRAFTKNDWATPPGEIPAAQAMREQYFAALEHGTLSIEDLPPEAQKRDTRRKTRKGHRPGGKRP